MNSETTWYATDRKDNALATATKAADTNQSQVLYAVYAAYSDLYSGTLTIKEGAVTRAVLDVQNTLHLTNLHIEFGAGQAISAELSASGGAGVFGSILLHGYVT